MKGGREDDEDKGVLEKEEELRICVKEKDGADKERARKKGKKCG